MPFKSGLENMQVRDHLLMKSYDMQLDITETERDQLRRTAHLMGNINYIELERELQKEKVAGK